MDDFFKSYCASARQLLGIKVKRMRILKGLSQKDFAERIGISPGILCRIESGDYNYTVDTLLFLCYHLHINLDFTL